MFGIGVGIRVGGRTAVSSGGGYDPDAQAFFDRVATAGGTLTTTEKTAVNQLVLDMKSAGIWTSMKAVYPMVGASVNLLSYTEDFGNAYWGKDAGVTVTTNTTTAPNGTLSADTISCNGTPNIALYKTAIAGLSGNYTISFYIKAPSGQENKTINFRMFNSQVNENITLTNEWVRYQFTTTAGANNDFEWGVKNSATATSFYLWGAQLELGSTATTYAPVLGNRTTEAAAACAQNLKSSSFTGTFTSGWTFASTGVTPNGTSAYMNTGLNPNGLLTPSSASFGVYLRTNIDGTQVDIGSFNGSNGRMFIYPQLSPTDTYATIADASYPVGVPFTTTNTRAFWQVIRLSSINTKIYQNATKKVDGLAVCTILPNVNFYLGANNNSGTASAFSTRENAFSYIGDGLTDTQASNFYTAVQAFQTTLSRQV